MSSKHEERQAIIAGWSRTPPTLRLTAELVNEPVDGDDDVEELLFEEEQDADDEGILEDCAKRGRSD